MAFTEDLFLFSVPETLVLEFALFARDRDLISGTIMGRFKKSLKSVVAIEYI